MIFSEYVHSRIISFKFFLCFPSGDHWYFSKTKYVFEGEGEQYYQNHRHFSHISIVVSDFLSYSQGSRHVGGQTGCLFVFHLILKFSLEKFRRIFFARFVIFLSHICPFEKTFCNEPWEFSTFYYWQYIITLIKRKIHTFYETRKALKCHR